MRVLLAGKQINLSAAGLRCTEAAISQWETGRRLPSLPMLHRIVQVFAILGATSDEVDLLLSAWSVERRRPVIGETKV